MHDALNVESCKINSSLHLTLDITYIASAPAYWTTNTDIRRCDEGTKNLSTFSVAYDYTLNPHQIWTDTTICKENDFVYCVYFKLF